MALYCLNATSQIQKSDLQGAWRLVAFQEIEDGKVITYFPGKQNIEQIKIWSGNQYMFVGQRTKSKKTRDDYGLGTFKMIEDKYEEYLTIFSYKHLENKTLRLKMEIKNDTLIQTFFLNDKFEIDNNTKYIEKYIKII